MCPEIQKLSIKKKKTFRLVINIWNCRQVVCQQKHRLQQISKIFILNERRENIGICKPLRNRIKLLSLLLFFPFEFTSVYLFWQMYMLGSLIYTSSICKCEGSRHKTVTWPGQVPARPQSLYYCSLSPCVNKGSQMPITILNSSSQMSMRPINKHCWCMTHRGKIERRFECRRCGQFVK